MNKLPALVLAVLLAWLIEPARAVEKDAVNRAIDKGVKGLRDMKRPDGTWPYMQIGATALAGLTLLECGVKADDKDVAAAAAAVRKASVHLTHTYSLALSILFLDRLGEADDVPLIESLMVRLLAGQNPNDGGWTYDCPSISAAESRRLQAKIEGHKQSTTRRETEAKRTVKDLAPEIREQLAAVERGQWIGEPGNAPPVLPNVPIVLGMSDNSNTQFAALALWVGRRHGLPVERALTRLDRRFRTTQQPDGGWTYRGMGAMPEMRIIMPGMGMDTTASMTCAGVLALAIVDGATLEYHREHKTKGKELDISEDKQLNKGLEALGTLIDNPKGLKPQPQGNPWMPPERVGGRTYYFLWSLERAAVALDLDTLGKKDWYGWGAEILLENQMPDGRWFGDYSESGADTCFALLFLRRANLARDLTAQIKGKVKDPGERVLRSSVALDGGRGKKGMKTGIESKDSKPLEKRIPKAAETESSRLADALVKAPAARRGELLETMEEEKGLKYTEALAAAIPRLEGESHRKAREALANRLTRMKDETLADYLQDDDAEIRRAAALAIGQKESKKLLPHLISLLRDSEISVVRAAHASLKALTGEDFGPAAKATREERDQAVLKWIEWWSKQRKKSTRE